MTATRSNTPPTNPLTGSSPFKGEAGWGMGLNRARPDESSPLALALALALGHLVGHLVDHPVLTFPLEWKKFTGSTFRFSRGR